MRRLRPLPPRRSQSPRAVECRRWRTRFARPVAHAGQRQAALCPSPRQRIDGDVVDATLFTRYYGAPPAAGLRRFPPDGRLMHSRVNAAPDRSCLDRTSSTWLGVADHVRSSSIVLGDAQPSRMRADSDCRCGCRRSLAMPPSRWRVRKAYHGTRRRPFGWGGRHRPRCRRDFEPARRISELRPATRLWCARSPAPDKDTRPWRRCAEVREASPHPHRHRRVARTCKATSCAPRTSALSSGTWSATPRSTWKTCVLRRGRGPVGLRVPPARSLRRSSRRGPQANIPPPRATRCREDFLARASSTSWTMPHDDVTVSVHCHKRLPGQQPALSLAGGATGHADRVHHQRPRRARGNTAMEEVVAAMRARRGA